MNREANRDSFSGYHPFINFGYFAVIIAFSMLFMHPVFQAIALFSAIAYSIMLKRKKAITFNVLYMLPLLLGMAALNPLFNHAGVTILFYLKNGNPITLESILYGLASACMFVTVIVWFSCYNAVMTSDKFIYLFGRILPALSLIFSMALRLVPRYMHQIKIISNAQRSIGRDVTQGSLLTRVRNGLTILSIMTTWALENAIETADSMKARGYGLPGRTSFSLYRFDRRDKAVLAIMLVLIAAILYGWAIGENTMRYFPSMKAAEMTAVTLAVYVAYFGLCLLPVITNAVEELKWKAIESRT
ncbi:energy-coupling factor transporter transmembrane component T [Paenibacillus sp. 2TAB19]|uniref:energy-coupling factor transporter transmembrane component T n=1 Tax=Paenibacillus sp. 2TAB19 TaxID=3233003 RepID=UPI003F98C01C